MTINMKFHIYNCDDYDDVQTTFAHDIDAACDAFISKNRLNVEIDCVDDHTRVLTTCDDENFIVHIIVDENRDRAFVDEIMNEIMSDEMR